MLTVLQSDSPTGFCPTALGRLAGDLATTLFHEKHGLRHPLGIYNVSLAKVEARFKKALERISPFLEVRSLKETKQEWLDQLLEAQEALLYAIDEHFDDCQSVLDCFFPERAIRKKNSHVKQFLQQVETYKDHVAELVNKMKHRNARLRGVILGAGDVIVPGYFIEAVFPDGALGPDPGIHLDQGHLTAISFFRDLRLHFVELHLTSERLAKAVDKLAPSNKHTNNVFCPWRQETGKSLASLPPTYYPNEIMLRNPWVVWQEEDGRSSLQLSVGKPSPKPITFHGAFEVLASYRGDSVTRSFKLPYSGPMKQPLSKS